MEGLADLALVLSGTLIVGFLSLLAQGGRKNWVAEILLLFAIVSLSLLVVALGMLVGLLGASSASGLPPELFASSAIVLVLAGLAGAAICVPPLLKIFRRRSTTSKSAAPPDP